MHRNPPGRIATTAFWGGGTPGLLPVADLERLARAMIRANHHTVPAEWTVEMAPATVKREKVRLLKDLGVNRLSMGVQSFNPKLLEELGRIHSLRQVEQAVEILHGEDMANFNLDLIFAIPGQSREMWIADLEQGISANPAHISTYCLTFEEDTALWLRLQKGAVARHSPEDEAEFHEISSNVLGSAGFEQYEVSNYARPGRACEHNINTWRMQEWIGYGPSASSQFAMRRWTEAHSLEQWQAGVKSGQAALAEDLELTQSVLAQDFLIFGLRMNAGVDLSEWRGRFGATPLPGWDAFQQRLIAEQLGILNGNMFQLTESGRLLADRIGSEILMLTDT